MSEALVIFLLSVSLVFIQFIGFYYEDKARKKELEEMLEEYKKARNGEL
jgi:uncharacterized protein YneF (UPF0154 family)